MTKQDYLEKKLYEEAYNYIQVAKNATELRICLLYYLNLAIGVGFDKGINQHVRHNAKPVMAIGNGKVLKFDSVEQATFALKTSHHSILKSIRSNGKRLCKGMVWEYINIQNNTL